MRDCCRLEEAVVRIMFVEKGTDTVAEVNIHVKELQRLGALALARVLARVGNAMLKHD